MQRVFVTGGTGFIGRHLVDELTRRKIPTVCLVRSLDKARGWEERGIVSVVGQVDRPETYERALARCDLAIHIAGLTQARRSSDLMRVNGQACGYLADACVKASVSRLVYLSSLAAAGPVPPSGPPRAESDPEQPISEYGRSKLAGEQEFRHRAERLGTSVIRPGIVYGPGDAKLNQMIQAIARHGIHLSVGRPGPLLSFIHVDDLVELILLVAASGETLPVARERLGDQGAGIYFACDDREFLTYGEFGQRVASELGRRVTVWSLRRPVAFGVAAVTQAMAFLIGRPSILNVDKIREATASGWLCSAAKAKTQLGFLPSKTMAEHLPGMVRAPLGPLIPTG